MSNQQSFSPMLLIMILLVAMMVFTFWNGRRNNKRAAERMAAMGVGDRVITQAGFIGVIAEAREKTLILQSEDGSLSEWHRRAVVNKIDEDVEEAPAVEAEESTAVDLAKASTASVNVPGEVAK